ncbi:hypothetical protein [Acidianus bottle-shaped virus 2 strain ABV2]|uniref:Uncharacterized protein n=1 Tax=Acidianus bottle-shaped virus 2 strain ABV2 TaxID=1732173 RepID=A0A0N9NI32_9VIRU|nr:hypothetical protein AVU01_gp25 [Acidianus bottle-shaped virus 2 strain ABV2]ALG96773.1 hypothetical protein [Acidianus bottle-shaped virus 2 strain ABV2]
MAKPIYVKPPRQEVVEVEKVEKPRVQEKVVEEEKVKVAPVEKEKVKQTFDYSPEQSLSRFRTFAPSYSYDYDFAPEDFSSTSQIYSPAQSYDSTFAPIRSTSNRRVYSPSRITNQRYAPSLNRRVAFKPRLFDKLLAIFAPETIVKQKVDEKYKPYDYTFQETAIIDTYDPEQLTTVEKFAPKDESNFNLRIAPETDFSIKLSPPPLSITSVNYYGILKKILR